MIAYQLLRPVSYLSVYDDSKWKMDWLIPLVISGLITAIYIFLPYKPEFYSEDGTVTKLQGFLQILPGFYLAALAAVATFDKSDLDKYMPTPTPEIDTIYEGKEVRIKLTRRRMLCHLLDILLL